MTWTPCKSPAVADIIRWKEPIWAAPNKPRGKPDQIGEQLLSAEVKAIDEYLELQIQSVEVLSIDKSEKSSSNVKVGDQVKRKKSTIERGDCHRFKAEQIQKG